MTLGTGPLGGARHLNTEGLLVTGVTTELPYPPAPTEALYQWRVPGPMLVLITTQRVQSLRVGPVC